MKKNIIFLIILVFSSSCFKSKEKGALFIKDKTSTESPVRIDLVAELERRIRLLEEKELAWKEIEDGALLEFKKIEKIVRKKCYDCHDSDTKLPFYGRAFPSVNPINRHQVEGLEALDFVDKFPLKSKGSLNQISLLNAFRNSVVEKSMPLKSYTLVYPFRKIRKKDQKKLLAWIDPLLEKVQGFEERFAEVLVDPSPAGLAKRVFEAKCFRCHANGIAKGGFGGMEDLKKLANSKFINIEAPTLSEVYTLSLNKEMPPNMKESLTDEELETVLEWIQSLSDEKS